MTKEAVDRKRTMIQRCDKIYIYNRIEYCCDKNDDIGRGIYHDNVQ